MSDEVELSSGNKEIPTMQVLMQLDTPPCFGQDEQEGDFYAPCPGCCTCLCPNPPEMV